MATPPRIVIVHRRTELQELLDRHATRGQAEFFLRSRGRSIQDAQDRHDRLTSALAIIRAAVPSDWRQAEVERADLSRFLLTAEDIIAVVGQDGLVANVAKYLNGQPVIGIDPSPARTPASLSGTHRRQPLPSGCRRRWTPALSKPHHRDGNARRRPAAFGAQ